MRRSSVDLLLDREPRARASRASLTRDEPLAAPHLLDAEVGHAAPPRGAARRVARVAGARGSGRPWRGCRSSGYPHTLLLPRAFELRDNATFYDALYLALAEVLGATLLTRDRRSPGYRASRLGSR